MLEETLRVAKIVDPSKVKGGSVQVGSKVKLSDIEFDEEVEYSIVGSLESNPNAGLISNESPIGKAIIGKKVGDKVMIETPAAAMTADRFAAEADFFSIGSNDLIQYTIAADRSNERVGHLYQPGHPSVLRLIKYTVSEAVKQNIPVSVCGQIAEDTAMVPFLLGLGVNELSMSPGAMPLVKKLIRSLSMHECGELSEKAMQCSNSTDVMLLSRQMIARCAPELLDL
jgi:phosphotransferase system enzyme I (PtsI)